MATASRAALRTRAEPRAHTAARAGWSASDVAAPAVLALVVCLWAITFSVLVVLKHERFASVDFDMGIHDQSVWLLSHLRGFLTVRGLQVFGHHATPGYFLFVPFYWLGGGPNLLNVTQVCVAALGAVPVYLLARFRTNKAWVGVALGIAYLLHPALQFFVAELFHPEVLAITPLLCAYYCSVRRRWLWFAFFAVLAVCWKEDLALAVVVLGLIIALRGDRRIGLITAGVALAWFALWIFALFPLLNGGKVQGEGLYTDVGGSPGGVIGTLFSHPTRITDRLVSSDSADYAWKLLAPYGLTAVLAPISLLLAGPQWFLNLVTSVPWTKTITFHYAALPFAAVTIASVEGVSFVVRRWRARVGAVSVAVVVLACALITTIAWGPSPIGREYRRGWWALDTNTRLEVAQEAVDVVPDGAPVSATYNLLPHLTHRAEAYSFPNPWRSQNFGIDGEPRRSPADVAWIVADRNVFDDPTAALFDHLVNRGTFEVVFERDNYVVARRVR
jgi:uncharacterized membrane protein